MAYIPNEATIIRNEGGLDQEATSDPEMQAQLFEIKQLLKQLVEIEGAPENT
jgi:hypothetical protein